MAATAEPGRRPGGERLNAPRRVALLGAESTGKSSLALALGDRLGGIVVAEYLREFCDRAGRVPRADEQAGIAAEQARRENLAVEAAAGRGMGWVICDTSPLMVALYSADCFDDHSLLADAIGRQRGYAATLVCMPDIDWVADGIMRMDAETRDRIHRQLVGLLDAHRIDWSPVTGFGEERIESAVEMLSRIE
ncbi:MAG: ATP-binding protein [Burkholderiaceae bacterium]|nr:ATP-binding protein [Burkholderiaceae bacterium]